jgi:hypothetical protein
MGYGDNFGQFLLGPKGFFHEGSVREGELQTDGSIGMSVRPLSLKKKVHAFGRKRSGPRGLEGGGRSTSFEQNPVALSQGKSAGSRCKIKTNRPNRGGLNDVRWMGNGEGWPSGQLPHGITHEEESQTNEQSSEPRTTTHEDRS